jgi:glycosyltransferase involved in cell wall biosynthesis
MARRLARLCDVVICGNLFLAEQFSQWNRNVRILPTAVDTSRFFPAPLRRRPGLIGWSGSSSGLPYLYAIETGIATVLERHPEARLRIISDRPPAFRMVPPHRVEFVPWTPEVEVKSIQELSIGLMPLEDTDWERGKCSYKMLLYAACGVPAVASPVGMNAAVLSAAEIGYAPATTDEWVQALDGLLLDPDDAIRRGQRGRELMVRDYSVDIIGPRLAALLREAAGRAASTTGETT